MAINRALFTSDSAEWETPDLLFAEWDKQFHFTLDVCASAENKKVKKYFDKQLDGLTKSWQNHVCWMNPPYGKEIKHWMKKAYHESKTGGCVVVCLLPARTDTKWFHDWVYKKAELIFLKGRLNFKGGKHTAPFPSMIAVFGKKRSV